METVRVVCAHDCPDMCSLLAEVEGGRVVRIKGDPEQPFTAGLHTLKDMLVYTSRGTGYWGPPKRIGAPSEITHLRLVPA